MLEGKPKQKKYASAGNPTINAVIRSLFSFSTQEQADQRISQIKDHFVISKQAVPDERSIILWIRGFEVTKAEAVQNYTGNFARISAKKKGKKITLVAEKIPTELSHHPQRQRPKQKHPDWGHPILRGIKKKRSYETGEEAAAELQRLHEAFPEVSIPGEAQLMIILYEKVDGSASPVQKYKFEVKPLAEGGFFIDYKRNTKAIKPKTGTERKPSEGYFTSMVQLKRNRKKPVKKPEDKPSA